MAKSTKIKVAVYCRFANYSSLDCMENQKEAVSCYAIEQGYGEYSNIRIYADNGASCNDFNRPGFTGMMADIAKGGIDTIVAKSIDRISRNYIATGQWLSEMRNKGIIVKTMDGFCSETTLPELEEIHSLITEGYKKQRKDQRMAGIKRRKGGA